MQRFQKRGDGQIHGPEHVGRVDENLAKQSSQAKTNELRGDDNEDSGCLVGIASIEQFLGGQCFSCQCGLRCC